MNQNDDEAINWYLTSFFIKTLVHQIVMKTINFNNDKEVISNKNFFSITIR